MACWKRRRAGTVMPALRELQSLFRESLLAGDEEAVMEQIEGDGLDPRARLAVYRHHIFTSLTAVLEAAYPVVCRLVDRRFFAYAADAFIRQHPPTGPCLAEYGAAFPDFLAGFPPCEGLPYLPDVARLEWAIHRASETAPTAPLDHPRLSAVAPVDMPRLRFAMDPTLSFLTSPWPVDTIWRAHQGGGEPAQLVDLDTGGVCLEVRAGGDVAMLRALEPATYAFRDALARGLTLGEGASLTLESHPSFDLIHAIQELLDERLFSDFTVIGEDRA
jgi:hypothetical protein